MWFSLKAKLATLIIVLAAGLSTALSVSASSGSQQKSCRCDKIGHLIKNNTVPPQYASHLLELAAAQPGNALVHQAVGMYYEQQGLPYPAMQEYEESRVLAPQDERSWLGQIRIALKLKQFTQAEDLWTQAHNRFPTSDNVDFVRFLILNMEGKKAAADSYLDDLIVDKPGSPQLKTAKATVLANNRQFKNALLLCNQVLNKYGPFMPALFLKGSILQQLGRKAEAFESMRQCFDKSPYNALLCRFYLRYLLAAGRMDLALEPALALLAVCDRENDEEVIQAKFLSSAILVRTPERKWTVAAEQVSTKLKDREMARSFHQYLAAVFDALGLVDEAFWQYKRASLIEPCKEQYIIAAARYAESTTANLDEATALYRKAWAIYPNQSKNFSRQIDRLSCRSNLVDNDIVWQWKVLLHRAWASRMRPLAYAFDVMRLKEQIDTPLALLGLPGRTMFRETGNSRIER